jgi:hypothetical protein
MGLWAHSNLTKTSEADHKGLGMSSPDADELRTRLREAGLRLDFAKNFLRELQTDGQTGFDHDAAMSTAVRAVAQAEAEYGCLDELLTKAIGRQQQLAESRGAERRPAAAQD